jgi:Arm DNA-binding domain
VKFTIDAVAALKAPAGKADHVAWDSSLPGFGVRIRGANKHWTIQYRVGQQQRKESLGDIRKVTLDAARKIARSRFAQAELGIDPTAQRREQEAKRLTIAAVGKLFLEDKEQKVNEGKRRPPNTTRGPGSRTAAETAI